MPVKGESGASNRLNPATKRARVPVATQEPHKTHAPLLDLALPPLTETLRPLRGERQERCKQNAVNRSKVTDRRWLSVTVLNWPRSPAPRHRRAPGPPRGSV